MTIKQRAINDEQKLERRQVILDTAWQLLQTRSYAVINIIDVAQAANLAKGTVYLYFSTKEALFLAVLEQQFADWFDEVDARLEQPISAGELVSLLVQSLTTKPTLSYLFAIAHVILEHNIEYETAKGYKYMLLARVTHTGARLEKQLPFFKNGQGAQFLLRAYSLVIGVENIARPAQIVQNVLDDVPELAIFKADFATEFWEMLSALVNYYQGENNNG